MATQENENISVPPGYVNVLTQIIKQMEEFEKVYGSIPDCQIIMKSEYKKLITLLSKE